MKINYAIYGIDGKPKSMPKLSGSLATRFCNILDIDGVIADNTHRLPCIIDADGNKLANPDWDTYKSLSYKDAPITNIMEQLRREKLYFPYEITFYLTGREESEADLTIEWYNRNKHLNTQEYLWGRDVCFIFRSNGDRRKAREIKKEMLCQLLDLNYVPLTVVDDWQENIDMYSEMRDSGELIYRIAHVKDREICASFKRKGECSHSIKRDKTVRESKMKKREDFEKIFKGLSFSDMEDILTEAFELEKLAFYGVGSDCVTFSGYKSVDGSDSLFTKILNYNQMVDVAPVIIGLNKRGVK